MDIEQLKRGEYFRLVEWAVGKLEAGNKFNLDTVEHELGIIRPMRFVGTAIVQHSHEGGYRVREEAMISYLQFVQLEAVQESAKSADRHATIAFWTAIAAIVIGAVIGIVQIGIAVAGCH